MNNTGFHCWNLGLEVSLVQSKRDILYKTTLGFWTALKTIKSCWVPGLALIYWKFTSAFRNTGKENQKCVLFHKISLSSHFITDLSLVLSKQTKGIAGQGNCPSSPHLFPAPLTEYEEMGIHHPCQLTTGYHHYSWITNEHFWILFATSSSC